MRDAWPKPEPEGSSGCLALTEVARGRWGMVLVVWQGRRCRVQEFLGNEGQVSKDEYEAALRALGLAAEFGPSQHPGRVKKLRSSCGRLWELCPTKHLRITCTLAGRRIVLLTAFHKTKQRTPKKEIERAERLRRQLEDEGAV